MNKTIKIKILVLTKNNGSITELLKDGFSYGQIARMTNELIEKELISSGHDNLELTEQGHLYLRNNLNPNQQKGSEQWILPEEKSKIEKLKPNELYLPSRNELDF